MRLALARYALFCSGCALIQLAHLTASRRHSDVRLSRLSVGTPAIGAAGDASLFGFAGLHRRTRGSRVVFLAAVASLAAELATGFLLFRWWVALVIVASVTVVVDLAALGWPRRLALLAGALASLAGLLAMLS